MNQELEELQYIEDYLEFSNYASDSLKSFLQSEGYVISYDGIVTLTKSGMNFLNKNKENNFVDNPNNLDYYDIIDELNLDGLGGFNFQNRKEYNNE